KQLLLTALYQQIYLDNIPKRAIFNETIEIAKVKGHAGVRKFVTGILHAIDRQGLPSLDAITDPIEALSIATSTPQWLVEQLQKEVG
ncbi:16S rRNA (cytosine(967)-C(5))-methyltransferase RsmB, partial [Streptococcus danieliae]|nr:16S rRNA (cytosine(967)-C(5))-methyltransferase RsmB [Streptococcus danieliae]